MPLAVLPATLPNAKKKSFYQVFLTTAGGILPIVSWGVTGAFPAWLSLVRLNENLAVVQGRVPNALSAATFSVTITATDSTPTTPLTATCVTTTGLTIVDGPDEDGYHGVEANRATVQTVTQVHQLGLTSAADAIQRMWPLAGVAQNS